jgi:CubicO group peptidase (beta-lactamase class C family)
VKRRFQVSARWKIRCGAIFAFALLTHPGGAWAGLTESAEVRRVQAELDAYLEPLEALDVFQGAVLIASGDRVLAARGYGFANVELQVPNSVDKVFRIASVSKPFTEVAIGRLAEEKRLNVTDALSRFMPDFPSADRITIEMLLAHRAGVPSMNSIPYDEEAFEPNTLDSLVGVLRKRPLDFDAGTQRRYSNGGYAILASVIEKVTGMSYDRYLQVAVFDPLGLEHTRHEGDNSLVPNRASGYMPSPDERHGLVPAPFQQMATKTGGGSLVSTVGDLHRFLRSVYHDNVISAATWRKLFPPSDSSIAFQGRCPGFNAYAARDLEHDVDVVVLANNYASGMLAEVGRDLLEIAQGRSPRKPVWKSDVAGDPAAARGYAGVYRAPSGSLPYGDLPLHVRQRDAQLTLYLGRSPVDVLIPQSKGMFLLRNLWSEIEFVGGENGEASQAIIKPLWMNKVVTADRVTERDERK